MDGKEVFKVAIPSLVQGVEESLKIAGININEVNWYVPHQANLRIIDSVAKKLEIDMDKVVVTVDHHGNTSAASIPLALAIFCRRQIQKRRRNRHQRHGRRIYLGRNGDSHLNCL